jgi:hypothetical protein
LIDSLWFGQLLLLAEERGLLGSYLLFLAQVGQGLLAGGVVDVEAIAVSLALAAATERVTISLIMGHQSQVF